MPKVPTYTLTWSPATATYELYETRRREVLKIVPDSPPGLPGWSRCPPLPSPASAATIPHVRKPNSVVIATGTPASWSA
jgi:hypothetical protein